MEIKQNIKLSDYNTFKTGGNAEYFCEVQNEDELINALKFSKDNNIKFIVIGNGSNLLISDEGFSGLVIKMSIKGNPSQMSDFAGYKKISRFALYFPIKSQFDGAGKIESKNDGHTIVSASAGESFDDFITFITKNGLSGVENLWNIPGTIGASVVQNIGAYGTEVKDYIFSVEVIDTDNFEKFTYNNENCNFGYRNSIFKQNKNLVIIRVFFKLNNIFIPNFKYPALKGFFLDKKNISIIEVIKAIEEIRKNKLPDWRILANAGSFFKNPIISEQKYNNILTIYPDLPCYKDKVGFVKIPLGYVIDKICGLKGYREGQVGLYEKQSLIIVNYGGASYFEIDNFAKLIEKKVFEKIQIKIEREIDNIF